MRISIIGASSECCVDFWIGWHINACRLFSASQELILQTLSKLVKIRTWAVICLINQKKQTGLSCSILLWRVCWTLFIDDVRLTSGYGSLRFWSIIDPKIICGIFALAFSLLSPPTLNSSLSSSIMASQMLICIKPAPSRRVAVVWLEKWFNFMLEKKSCLGGKHPEICFQCASLQKQARIFWHFFVELARNLNIFLMNIFQYEAYHCFVSKGHTIFLTI